MQLLAVSGGGENGAFGSGLLCGWSEHGTRPVFELVTGVSTGALTAPFAYLGSGYDPQLRAVYTELKSSSVFSKRGLTAALFDDALSDNSPLFKTISGYLNEAMLAALANAYEEGRLLLIGTTDLDAQQPVIWNMGAIAKSGHPRALDTIRRILLASAAIPGAFPPTLFDVVLDGSAISGAACGRWRLRAGVPLPGRPDTAAAHTYDAWPAGGAGDRRSAAAPRAGNPRPFCGASSALVLARAAGAVRWGAACSHLSGEDRGSRYCVGRHSPATPAAEAGNARYGGCCGLIAGPPPGCWHKGCRLAFTPR